MSKTLSEWNKYLEDIKRLRDLFYTGTKTTEGLNAKIEMEDCDIIWDLLNREANHVFSMPLDFSKGVIK